MTGEPSLPMLWSESALVSALVWITVSILSLYLARGPAHGLIDRLCQALARILRFAAGVLLAYARRGAARNREILCIVAEEASARRLERQFRRVGDLIERDLGGYPALHRALSEQVGRIDADYRQAADAPPTPPAWLAAVQAIATIDASGDPAVTRILRDMHTTLEASCHNALLEYRAASQRRYRGLRRMQPYFRRIAGILEHLQRRLDRIATHARSIDAQMASYEALRMRRRESTRALAFDLPIRVISGLALLAVAGLAATLNHRLIAAPLDALLGSPAGAETWTATSALMLIELGLGVWIAETLGLTRLLDLLGHFDDRLRQRLVWIAAAMLTALALLQAGLVWSTQMAADVAPLPGPAWLTPLAAALLGFVLPFVLALAAVPLETVVYAGQALLAGVLAGTAHLAAVALRLTAEAADALPPSLKKLYDLWIFLPLWCEQVVRATRARASEPADLVPERAAASKRHRQPAPE